MKTPDTGNRSLFTIDWRGAINPAAVALGLLLLSGCGSEVAQQAQTARPSEETQTDFGDLELHYNAIRTDQLTPDVARVYGIERSPNRVLLNVAMLKKTTNGAPVPVDGKVTAAAHNLNGQLKNLEMRRVQEGTAVYFIGEVDISGDEILVFNITAEPAAGGGSHAVQFKREFFAD